MLNGEKQDWQEFHERILKDDSTAFAELCEVALDYISDFINRRLSMPDQELCDSLAIDTLLKYREAPEKYNPQKSSLRTYLCMDARGDMLNELEKRKRRNKRIVQLDEEFVELQSEDGNSIQEDIDDWLLKYTSISREQLLQELSDELSPIDIQIVISMSDGIRDVEHYSAIIGVQNLSAEERKREVKRAKDRIKKKLERFGKRKGAE